MGLLPYVYVSFHMISNIHVSFHTGLFGGSDFKSVHLFPHIHVHTYTSPFTFVFLAGLLPNMYISFHMISHIHVTFHTGLFGGSDFTYVRLFSRGFPRHTYPTRSDCNIHFRGQLSESRNSLTVVLYRSLFANRSFVTHIRHFFTYLIHSP